MQEAVTDCVIARIIGAETASDTAHFGVEANVREQIVVE